MIQANMEFSCEVKSTCMTKMQHENENTQQNYLTKLI